MAAVVVASLLGGGDLARGQESNQVFAFQARVTQGGTPLESAGLQLTFQVYDAVTGGTKLWEETHASVPVTNGILCVELGQATAIGDTFTVAQGSGQDRFVAVRAGGATDPEIVVPRVKLTAVPYTLTADMAVGIDDGTGTSLAITDLDARYGDGKILPGTNAGRISVSGTDSAPSSVTGSTVYLHRHEGKHVSLYYDGEWKLYEIPEDPTAPGNTGSRVAISTDGCFDVFAVAQSDTAFVLEEIQWTSYSNRATTLDALDGVWVASGGGTVRKRYLGTVSRVSGLIRDNNQFRDVWNVDNQVQRAAYVVYGYAGATSATSWTEITPAFRAYFTVGRPCAVVMTGGYAHSSSVSTVGYCYVGWDAHGTYPPTGFGGYGVVNYAHSVAGSPATSSNSFHLTPLTTEGRHYSSLLWYTGGGWLTCWNGQNRVLIWN